MTFETTKQDKYWPIENLKCKYYIKNEVLAKCIGMGDGLSNEPDGIPGFSYDKCLGYALLTYFLSQALDFRRLPFYEDRIYSKYIEDHNRKAPECFFINDVEVINEITEEVKLIYQHTQEKLRQAGLSTVKLKRVITNYEKIKYPLNYVQTIMHLKDCANVLNKESIQFEMDMLNSFSDEGGYEFRADIIIEHEFAASDVLCCSNLIDDLSSTNLMESGEWIIINRSLTGLVEFPISSIRYDGKHWTSTNHLTSKEAEKFLSEHTPLKYIGVQHLPYDGKYRNYGKFMGVRKKIAEYILGI